MRSAPKCLLALGLCFIPWPIRANAAPPQDGTSETDILTVVHCFEGFESNSVPPPGWIRISQNPAYSWKLAGAGLQHGGYYAADVEYDPTPLAQDEWLLSPKGRYQGTFDFWTFGSLYWCRDIYDNCDLEVWLVQGPNAGDGDDPLLGEAESAWTASWTWAMSTFSFDSVTPNGLFRLAFRYTGLNGAQIILDDISYDAPCAVFGADFEGDNLAEWSTSQP